MVPGPLLDLGDVSRSGHLEDLDEAKLRPLRFKVFFAKDASDLTGWSQQFFCSGDPAAPQPLSAVSQRDFFFFFLLVFAHADVSDFFMGRDPFEGLPSAWLTFSPRPPHQT